MRDAARPEESEARSRAAHANRDLSTWVDRDGAGRLAWRGTPDALAGIRAVLTPFVKDQLSAARRAGRDEPYGACAADALCTLVDTAAGDDTTDRKRAIRPVIRARVDLAVLRRGRTEPGDVCELEGVGPVPVSVIDRLAAQDPIVDLILTKGREVTHVAHLGRSGDTFLRAAIEWRDPSCRIDSCHRTSGLEAHHLDPVADDGRTSLENQVRICGHHHDLITHHHYELTGDHDTGWHLRAPPPDTG